MDIGKKVILNMPGCKFHNKTGTITEIRNDDLVLEFEDVFQKSGKRKWYAKIHQVKETEK